MRILLLEDNSIHADTIREELSKSLPKPIEVVHVQTESDFRAWIATAADWRPDVANLDVMVPWARPAPNMPGPPEDMGGGADGKDVFFTGGVRCLQALRAQMPDLPVIIYSVLGRAEVASYLKTEQPTEHIRILSKDGDQGSLVNAIKSMTT